jgi:beta-glucosidase
MADLVFPKDFLFGCATAAHQVEGGNNNDWTNWEPEHILDRSVSGTAIDHYNRYPEDLKSLASLGQNAHRFSVEWSRVEPTEGEFDPDALRHYVDVVKTCRDLKLEPILTLQHFTLPKWLAKKGGVLSRDAPKLFARYAAVCAEALGPHVTWWVTINEPNIYGVMAYLRGEFPPGEHDIRATLRAMAALLRMHAAGALAIRAISARHERRAAISFAHHERPLRAPEDGTVLDRLSAKLPNFLFNRWFLKSAVTGRMLPPIGHGQRIYGLETSLDWLGVNFYSEEQVRFDSDNAAELFAKVGADPNKPQSSFGWAIDSSAFQRALLDLWKHFHLPIVITENGVSDENDELRPQFLVDYLAAVHGAIESGADIRGYLHWTAWDNFEWARGYSQKFGLFSVDHQTMSRKAKPSAAIYETICRQGLIPENLLYGGATAAVTSGVSDK